ncbi:MAG: VOC family protein [Deltaproteobacteria bacterium]|nr:VOC family protein [Deltaproteobacteria bacterium]
MLGLRHVALRVRNLQRALEFYSGVLGMRLEWQPDDRNAYLTTGSDNLALHEAADLTDSGAGSLDHIGFFVAAPEEVDEWGRRLEARGVTLVQQPRTHRDGARSIYFRDPDGNLVQLLYAIRTVERTRAASPAGAK